MATAKRWWNGSSWSSSEAYWLNGNTYSASSYCYIVYKIQVIAYDDGTIRFIGSVTPNDLTSTHALSSTKTFTNAGSTLTTFSQNERYRDILISVGSYPFTLGYSGNLGVYKMQQGTYYGNPWNASGSTSVTNPFAYRINYNANGGTGGPGIQAIMNGESPIIISSVIPTRTNRTFVGWTTSSTSHTAEYYPGDSITLSSNITLYAVWDPSDDGMAQDISVTYNNSTILTIPSMITICPIVYNNIEIATISGVATKTLNCQNKIMASDVEIGNKILNCKNKYMASNIIVTGVNAIYATIDVTFPYFPSGYTVSISPNYAYSIEDITDGKRFNVTRAGTYTITATSGSISRSVTATISSYGQTLSYSLEYCHYLIKDGVTMVGWTASATPSGQNGSAKAPSVSDGSGYKRASLSGKYSGLYRTSSTIDLSNYKQIVFDVAGYATNANQRSQVSLLKSGASWYGSSNNNYYVTGTTVIPTTTGATYTLNRTTKSINLNTTVSAYAGVGMYVNLSSGSIRTDIYNCYLVYKQ